MAKKLTDDDISVIIGKAISNSETISDGKLARERMEVERYVQGIEPKPMHAGDSKYISRDVFDAVDSCRATVLEAFLTNGRVVTFRPERGETVDDAKQATEYTRHVFFKENDGEQIMYDVLTDGLTKRFSFVKVLGEELEDSEEYSFENLTADELTAVVNQHDNFEFTEGDTDPDTGLFSGVFKVDKTQKRISVEVLQPEDCLIASGTSSVTHSRYFIHRSEKTKSYLLKAGFKESIIEKLTFDGSYDFGKMYEKQQRFEDAGDIISTDDGYQESVKTVTVYEAYIQLDLKGNGKSYLYRVVYAQGHILDKERLARMPVVPFVPLPRPHTFLGENYAKSVIPIQNARTVLIRQIINHTLITNNPRLQVVSGTVPSPAELLDNRIGGIVNVRRPDGILPIPQAPLNPYVFNLIQMIDEDKEEVTGISKLSQGLNKDAISTQNAQGMVEQLISQSQQRQKIIARRFGKFLRELFGLIYHTAIDFIDQDDYEQSLGSYVQVNPAQWRNRSAASVELTLGYGEQQAEAMKWIETDQYLVADPMLGPAYTYEQRYEVLRRAMEGRGIEDIEAILTPPKLVKAPEPSEAEKLQMEEARTRIEYQKAQAYAMTSKADSDALKAKADFLRAQTEALLGREQLKLDARELEHEMYIDNEELKVAKTVDQKSASFSPNVST